MTYQKKNPSKSKQSSDDIKSSAAKGSKATVEKNKSTKKTTSKSSDRSSKRAASKETSRRGKRKAITNSAKNKEEYIRPVSPIKFRVRNKRPDDIPEDQWNLPIGLKANGQYSTLADIASAQPVTYSLASLSGEDKRKLIIKRIEETTNYPVRQMLGVGTVDKQKAIEEVRANTPAGKFIAEAEQRLIQLLIQLLKPNSNE